MERAVTDEHMLAFDEIRNDLLNIVANAFPDMKTFALVITYGENDHDMFTVV